MSCNGRTISIGALLGLIALAWAPPAAAEGEASGGDTGGAHAGDDQDLAKAVQNPVADLISVPFQNNTSYNIGPYNRAQNALNIQPVIPVHLSSKVMLITRTILPIVYQPDLMNVGGGSSGVGDLNPTFFLSPANAKKLIWGAGPTLLIPTGTQRDTGTGKWGVGPAAVVLVQPHPWTIGVLASQIWSFAGPSDRTSVSALTIQYFVNYNLADAWYLSSSPIITANFKAPEGDAWTVPFGGGIGKIFRLGKLPLNGNIQGFYNVRNNDETIARWQLRVQLAFLFPAERKKKPEEKQGEKPGEETARAGTAAPPASSATPAPGAAVTRR